MDDKLKLALMHTGLSNLSAERAVEAIADWEERDLKRFSKAVDDRLITAEKDIYFTKFIVHECVNVGGVSIVEPGAKYWQFDT